MSSNRDKVEIKQKVLSDSCFGGPACFGTIDLPPIWAYFGKTWKRHTQRTRVNRWFAHVIPYNVFSNLAPALVYKEQGGPTPSRSYRRGTPLLPCFPLFWSSCLNTAHLFFGLSSTSSSNFPWLVLGTSLWPVLRTSLRWTSGTFV